MHALDARKENAVMQISSSRGYPEETKLTILPDGEEKMEGFDVERFVDAEGLLQSLFDDSSRPTVRWVRDMQKQRKIPHYKVGKLIRFVPSEVMEALRRKCRVACA